MTDPASPDTGDAVTGPGACAAGGPDSSDPSENTAGCKVLDVQGFERRSFPQGAALESGMVGNCDHVTGRREVQ